MPWGSVLTAAAPSFDSQKPGPHPRWRIKQELRSERRTDIAALPVDGANGRPLPLVVTAGDAEENRKLVTEHGIRCLVLLQREMEVASQYQANGTPMGYLISE